MRMVHFRKRGTRLSLNRDKLKDLMLAHLIFVAVLVTHWYSGNHIPIDSRYSIHTAMSIIREGNTDLDEYRPLISEINDSHLTETIAGHVYSVYPLGASLLALPFVFTIDLVSHGALAKYIQHAVPDMIESFVACFIVALTSVLIYAIARRSLNRRYALLVVFIFAFCTSAWSVASRALWQHGPSMLMLTATLYLLLLAEDRPRLSGLAGIPLALSYVMRPTNGISVALITAYILIRHRRHFLYFLLGALWVAVPFVAFNLSVYHSPLSNYYRAYNEFSTSTFWEALVGQWLSPSKGLLIFSPVFVFSFYGVFLKVKRKSFDMLAASLVGIVCLHWVSISVWPVWWGGWSFGPRMFSDMIPYLIYLLIPAVSIMPKLRGWKRALVGGVGLALMAISFLAHYRGANSPETFFDWNELPVPADLYPARVWEWRDIQFLRGIKYSLSGAPVDLAVSGISVERLDLSTYTLLGTNDLRLRWFDATSSAIAPPGETWVILGDGLKPAPEIAELFQDIVPASVAQTIYDHQPYRLLAFDLGSRIRLAAEGSEQIAWTSPILYPAANEVRLIDLPVKFNDTAELIGFKVLSSVPSNDVKVVTYWRAGNTVVAPLRGFVHMIGPDGSIVTQEDRLDVPSDRWRPADLIVQIFRLDYQHDMPVWIQLGLYNSESGERVPIMVGGREIDRRLLLKQLP